MRIMLLTCDKTVARSYTEAAEHMGSVRLSVQKNAGQALECLFRKPFDALLSDDGVILLPAFRKCSVIWPAQMFLLLREQAPNSVCFPDELTFCFSICGDPKDVLTRICMFPGGYTVPNDPEIRISRFLQEIGVPVSLSGFDCLREAIRLIVTQKHLVDMRSLQDLYAIIASEMQTSVFALEHAMRQAVDAAWARADTALLERIFGYTVCSDRSAPSNAAFLFRAADHIRLNQKERGERANDFKGIV